MALSVQPGGAVRAPLGRALEDELGRLELYLARLWVVFAAMGIAGSLALAAAGQRALGLVSSATSAGFLACFALHAWLLGRGHRKPAVQLFGHVLEGLVPWVFMLVLYRTQGVLYALGSWAPPLLAAVLLIVSTARLRPLAPAVLGASSSAALLLLYFLVLRPHLPAGAQPAALYSSTMQLSRAFSLLLGGLCAGAIAHTLREAIGRAERSVRAQDLFGKYRLESKVASGGMGVVYRARYCPEGGFERVVAVKLLHAHLAEQPVFLAGFRAEAELCAQLVHPNIVQVLDFGRVDEAYFLAMEYVDGLTLAALLHKLRSGGRALPPALVSWVGRELLAGLDHSHRGARDAQGAQLHVVHRDLCPVNVLLSRAGQVKIGDFGIARALRDASTTQTRTVAGHLGYMSPEQVQAGPLDERSDLFAVGVMLWELLALRPLFQRNAEGPTLTALMRGEVPDLCAERPSLDPRWMTLLLHALAPEARDRSPSAQALALALGALDEEHAGSHAEELAELVSWALEQPEPPPGVPPAAPEPEPAEPPTVSFGRPRAAPSSPDA